jgi:hypothetical protein
MTDPLELCWTSLSRVYIYHKNNNRRGTFPFNFVVKVNYALDWFNLRLAPSHPALFAFNRLITSILRFCEVWRTKALRGIEDAKSRAKWVSDYRTFPNGDIERGHEDLASLRCVMSYGNNDIID